MLKWPLLSFFLFIFLRHTSIQANLWETTPISIIDPGILLLDPLWSVDMSSGNFANIGLCFKNSQNGREWAFSRSTGESLKPS